MIMSDNDTAELRIGRWGRRFWAYVVDLLLVGCVTGSLFGGVDFMVVEDTSEDVGLWMIGWAIASSVFFAYFTILEWLTGYTVGKRIFKLRVEDTAGNGRPRLEMLLISNFGKSYVMPLDVFIGLIAFRDTRQRAFAKLAGTVTVRVPPEKSHYKLD